jgi:DNA invertase Pin-like site-specific DNA recombinase
MTTYGYARVSTKDQTLQSQIDALAALDCASIYQDTAGGVGDNRPGFSELLEGATRGGTTVVVSLDRFGRSLVKLIALIADFDQKGIGFRSLREQIDTMTPAGRLIFQIFGALAEFERACIRERTMAGLAKAAAQGRKGGRPTRINPKRGKKAREMIASGLTKEGTARALDLSRATLYRLMKDNYR